MSDANELAGLAAGLAIALPVALGLVWVCLLGTLRLLPQSPQRLGIAASPAPGTAGPGRAVARSAGSPRGWLAGLVGKPFDRATGGASG